MAIKKLHLIGGAPLTGKTTLATQIAKLDHAVQFSTDNVREWMKGVCSPKDYPTLFSGHNLTAEEYYEKFPTAEDALNEEIDQGRDVEIGLMAFLSIDLPWSDLVLEGIASTPEFTSKVAKKFPHLELEVTFLHDTNNQRIKDRVYRRGLWGLPDSYPDHIKPVEVEWVIGYNKWFLQQAQQFGYEITNIEEGII